MVSQKRTLSSSPGPSKRMKTKSAPPPLEFATLHKIEVTSHQRASQLADAHVRIKCQGSADTSVVCEGLNVLLKHGEAFESTCEFGPFNVVMGTRTLTFHRPPLSWQASRTEQSTGSCSLRTPFQIYETSTAPTTASTTHNPSTPSSNLDKSDVENMTPPCCTAGVHSTLELGWSRQDSVNSCGTTPQASQNSVPCQSCLARTSVQPRAPPFNSAHGFKHFFEEAELRALRSRRASI